MPDTANQGTRDGLADYYSALFGAEAARVTLDDGETLDLRRPPLGPSYYMDALGEQIRTEPLAQRVECLRKWLAAGGVPDPEALALGDIINTTQALQAMLPARGSMPFQLAPSRDPDPGAPPAIDYAGRDLAVIVHALANAYGWGIQEILDLPREVALAHAQEILVEDRRRRDWEHMLSEVAWGYNKTTGKSEYNALPAPAWEEAMKPTTPAGPEVPQAIRDKYDPKGVVVDLTKSRKEAGNAHNGYTKPTQSEHNGDATGT